MAPKAPSIALLLGGKPGKDDDDDEAEAMSDEDGAAMLDTITDTSADAADRMSAFRELVSYCK
ncbi:MAG: hypothetical protein FJ027_19245 [Candidatus Rokubacteria bacterium]|nr:hypothetical protein [Candidatus Rokubacteria bacterium]